MLLSNWDMAEATPIITRCFGFIVTSDDVHFQRGSRFSFMHPESFCFGAMLLRDFGLFYPDVNFSDSGVPVFAVFSREQTMLKLGSSLSIDGEMEKRFDAMVNVRDNPEMTISSVRRVLAPGRPGPS
jgi:hypothetical protein